MFRGGFGARLSPVTQPTIATGRNTMNAKQNIASKVGKWSAGHRKTAILGWLVFVVLAVGLMGSGSLEKQTLSSVDQIAGKAGEAERILDDAGTAPDRRDRADPEQGRQGRMTAAFDTVIEESAQSRWRRHRTSSTSSRRSTAKAAGSRRTATRPSSSSRSPATKKRRKKTSTRASRRSSASSVRTPSTPSASSAAPAPTKRSKTRSRATSAKRGCSRFRSRS